MQVFKAFMKIFNRNKTTVIVYVIIFLVLLIGMTNSGAEGTGTDFMESNFKYTVFNEDEGEAGQKLVDYLNLSNEFVEEEDDRDVLLDEMFYRNLDCAIYIPTDFSARLAAGETKELLDVVLIPGLQNGELAKTAINQYISMLQIHLLCDNSIEDADKLAREDLAKEANVKMSDGSVKEEYGKWAYYYTFMPYIFICVIMMGVGPILLDFSEKNVQMRNKCSATSLIRMNVEKILGCVVYVVICYVLFMLISAVLFPDYTFSLRGSLSMIDAGLFAIIALAFTFLAVQFVNTENALNMIGNTLGLAMSFLGGVFVPASWFSEGVLRISRLLPTYWYVKAIDEINLLKDGMEVPTQIIQYYGILLLFGVAVFAVGLVASKVRQQKA